MRISLVIFTEGGKISMPTHKRKNFDVADVSLPLNGKHLFEASAGTGKTYTICYLYLHHLLRNKRKPDQIVVVTFTEAAADQLKLNILQKVTLFRDFLEDRKSSNQVERDIQRLWANLENSITKKKATEILNAAIDKFDSARISTIHSFCLRILQEHPFSTGFTAGLAIDTNQNMLIDDLIADLFRKNVLTKDQAFLELVHDQIDSYLEKGRLIVTSAKEYDSENIRPSWSPPVPQETILRLIKDAAQKYEELRNEWQEKADSIWSLLAKGIQAECFKKDYYQNFDRKEYDALMKPETFNILHHVFSQAWNITSESCVVNALKKTAKASFSLDFPSYFRKTDELIDILNKLKVIRENDLIHFMHLCHKEAQKHMRQLSHLESTADYYGIMKRLHEAISGPNGPILVQRIRTECPIAMIDEFQDTDNLQYSIFKAIYDKPKDTGLYFVGDPKQSIYRFRGADYVTYAKASQEAIEKHSLLCNFRSSPKLVEAFNCFFKDLGNEKDFADVHLKAGNADLPDIPAPFRFVLSPLDFSFNKNEQYDWCQQWLVREIRRLHSEKPDRMNSFKYSDMAILVRTNNEGTMLLNKLLDENIPAITFQTEKLFVSREAKELLLLIEALHNPDDLPAVSRSLATEMIGFSAADIVELKNDEIRWGDLLEKFRSYHDIWSRKGFLPMMHDLLDTFRRDGNILERLAQFPDGERRLTNIFHLLEILQKQDVHLGLHPASLLSWLKASIRDSSEEEIRLESDKDAVKIVTIHKSKGLQYPVVFCPLLWYYYSSSSQNTFLYHDEKGERIFQLGASPEGKEADEKDRLKEHYRLLYVALTRAQQLCYLFIASTKSNQDSALRKHVGIEKHMDLDQVKKLLQEKFVKESNGSMTIVDGKLPNGRMTTNPKTEVQNRKLEALILQKPLPKPLMLQSFTGLSDRINIKEGKIGWDRKGLPPGGSTGTLLHNIIEEILRNHNRNDAIIRKVVEQKASGTIFNDHLDEIERIIAKALSLKPWKAKNFMDLHHDEMVQEMEFWFRIKTGKIREFYRQYSNKSSWWKRISEAMDSFSDRQITGWMNGKIDLVLFQDQKYHIVDWKSNYLAAKPDGYHRQRMEEEILSHGYFLQFHIYSSALWKYLLAYSGKTKEEIPSLMGDICYIFLRGIDGPEQGIYKEPIDVSFTEKLSAFLSGKEPV
jgi:exodeoxyribonuclease V beta subunit